MTCPPSQVSTGCCCASFPLRGTQDRWQAPWPWAYGMIVTWPLPRASCHRPLEPPHRLAAVRGSTGALVLWFEKREITA